MKPAILAAFRATLGVALASSLVGAAHADSRVTAGLNAFAHGRYVQAANLLTSPAYQGDPVAETYLGYMCQKGLGVPKDYAQAWRWLRAGAWAAATSNQK